MSGFDQGNSLQPVISAARGHQIAEGLGYGLAVHGWSKQRECIQKVI